MFYKKICLYRQKGGFYLQQKINYARLGLNIKKKRQEIKLTQEELAEMVGCYPSHISNIENNYTKASLNILLAIANSLGTSIDYFLSDQYSNPPSLIDKELSVALAKCDTETKERILRIIKAL